MDFTAVSKLSTLLAKPFAEDLLRLLVVYQNISASQAASRLDLHIKTAQDFLEGLTSLHIARKQEVYEGKRPYFRYTLQKKIVAVEFDLTSLYKEQENERQLLQRKIRERVNAGAMFSTAGQNSYISNVTVFVGQGRMRRERKITLTVTQGKFLYHLPFPTASYVAVQEIMKIAGLDQVWAPEILDIVKLLEELNVIESEPSSDL